MTRKMYFKNFAMLVLAAFTVVLVTVWNFPATVEASPTGRIIATGNTVAPRSGHTATLLPNGKVLLAGGMERNGVFLASGELYDPVTGQFSSAGKMQRTRGFGASAILLPNGKVLIAGGWNGSSCNRSAELYDPVTGVFTPTGSMAVPRCAGSALLSQAGKVFIIGGDPSSDNLDNPGSGSSLFISAEMYDPSVGAFSSAGSMQGEYSTAVLLKTGKVLVVGDSSAELYDPSVGRFTPTGNPNTERRKMGTALLPDGRVLIAGGQTGGAWGQRVAATEVYDPSTGKFIFGPDMNFKRFKLPKGVVPLRNGRILVAGGAEQPEVYDPVSGAFLPAAGSKLDGFCYSTATLLANGDVLIVGGYARGGGAAVSHAWLYKS